MVTIVFLFIFLIHFFCIHVLLVNEISVMHSCQDISLNDTVLKVSHIHNLLSRVHSSIQWESRKSIAYQELSNSQNLFLLWCLCKVFTPLGVWEVNRRINCAIVTQINQPQMIRCHKFKKSLQIITCTVFSCLHDSSPPSCSTQVRWVQSRCVKTWW